MTRISLYMTAPTICILVLPAANNLAREVFNGLLLYSLLMGGLSWS